MAPGSDARLLFLGERALAEGFALLGFETWPDAGVADLDRVLDEVRRDPLGAFVIIDRRLADAGSRLLPLVQAEGRRVVVIEVPTLANPEDFHLGTDEQVRALLGARTAED